MPSKNKRQKILIIGINHEYGGGVVAIGNSLARGLAESGHEVYLLQPEGTDSPRTEVQITSKQTQNFTTLVLHNWFHRLDTIDAHIKQLDANRIVTAVLDQIQPDIVHVQHIITYGADILRIIHERRIPLVLTLHDFWVLCALTQMVTPQFRLCAGPQQNQCVDCAGHLFNAESAQWQNRHKNIIELINASVDCVITDGHDQLSAMRENGIAADKSVAVHPASWSVDKLYEQRIQTPRPIKQGTLHLCYIGLVSPIKGVHTVIDAIAQLPTSLQRQVQFDIYGTISSATFETQLQSLTGQLDGAQIHFKGSYHAEQDLPAILNSHDVLITPSIWRETYGIVVEEALAAGCPVICSEIGGLQEHINNHEQGRLFQAGNIMELASLLVELLQNPGLLSAWQAAIKTPRLCQQYVEEIEKIYQLILQPSSP